MKFRYLFSFILVILLYGCHHSSGTRSFYYWRTTFHLSPKEEKYLTDLNIRKLYLRLFDVDWDETIGNAIPLGKITFVGKPPATFEYIPVVYIVNRTLQKTLPVAIPELTSKILSQVQNLMSLNKLRFSELQIDCDWNESTRNNYFQLLTLLGKELEKNKQTLSATIRLHQVKYATITGIPPIHKGMLMYYNMGKIEAADGRNSIYNKDNAAMYVDYVGKYPLPLDVALPSFSWGIHTRQHKVIELLNNMTSTDFKNNTNFRQYGNLQFTANSSFFFRGSYFMKADKVKVEEVLPETCLQAAGQVSAKFRNKPCSVAIFQLDSLFINKYEEKKLEEIFDSFH